MAAIAGANYLFRRVASNEGGRFILTAGRNGFLLTVAHIIRNRRSAELPNLDFTGVCALLVKQDEGDTAAILCQCTPAQDRRTAERKTDSPGNITTYPSKAGVVYSKITTIAARVALPPTVWSSLLPPSSTPSYCALTLNSNSSSS